MVDNARKWTDKQLRTMERRLKRIYTEAEKDMRQKWSDYMQRAAMRLKPLQDAYEQAKKSGDKELIKKTGKALGQAQRAVTMQDDYYKNMVDETTTQLANVNQTAVAYLNGQMLSVYAVNYNHIAPDAESIGIKFNLVNENTIKNLVTEGKVTLPQKKVNIPKDKRWNTRQLNNQVLQGILQGESMDKIAKRITPVVGNSQKAAIRNARTMVTGAENRGRLDSYRDLQDRGVVMTKIWIATPDSRTRDFHLSMDGQEVDIDDMFIDGNGNELEYPGDPKAAAETVYNCRCSQKSHIIGFRKVDGHIEYVASAPQKESLHGQQIKQEKEAREEGG